jgi:molybdopterin molybdotransferase
MMEQDEALKILYEATERGAEIEQVDLDAALGRVLAQAVVADMNVPPFNRSAMDGYAFKVADVTADGAELNICGVVAAGEVFERALNIGEAVKIMTGAPVPEGADAVQMVEKTEDVSDSRVRILKTCSLGQNIAPMGQDMTTGEVVLHAGTTIRPIEIGMLATLGQAQVSVFRRPSVTVYATGDELVPPGAGMPGPGQIRESNGSMLASQVRALGVGLEATFAGIVADTQEATRDAIEAGMEADVLILSGGVSMGDFDHVHHELKARGLEVKIQSVAIKPGKPLLFGRMKRLDGTYTWVFGLPGNPVSSFCTFELFVRPFLRGLIGLQPPHTLTVKATLTAPLRGRPIPRTQHLPAQVNLGPGGLTVCQVPWNGSGDLRGLIDANGFIISKALEPFPEEGDLVDVVLSEPEALRLPAKTSRGRS